MKINTKLVMTLALALSMAASNIAMAAAQKIAVVDVPAIVASSNQVKKLKDEQAKKAQDLAKWLETVRADVQKQSKMMKNLKKFKHTLNL